MPVYWEMAPWQVVSAARAEVRPHALNVERNVWVNVRARVGALVAAFARHAGVLGNGTLASGERWRSEGGGQAARVECGEERLGQRSGRKEGSSIRGIVSGARCEARDHIRHHRV
eukprot:scaffold9507_cov40-Phaeocystis_antarctica.AAC.2